MKQTAYRQRWGFSLIELLVVIAIIGLLAALVLTAISFVQTKAKVRKAQIEMAMICTAINDYEHDQSRYPVSTRAMQAAAGAGQDFTFGTYGLPTGLKTPGGTYDVRALDVAGSSLIYQTNNSEVMAVLLDVEAWPNSPTAPTINQGHAKNPLHKLYLEAKMTGDTTSPGVGSDGVYRDPWGQPYIITIDLNNDGKARDSFYRDPGISADPSDTNTPKRGLNGLMPTVVGGRTFYEARSPVMVWSAGPDKMVDPGPGVAANRGANRDNVLSWK